MGNHTPAPAASQGGGEVNKKHKAKACPTRAAASGGRLDPAPAASSQGDREVKKKHIDKTKAGPQRAAASCGRQEPFLAASQGERHVKKKRALAPSDIRRKVEHHAVLKATRKCSACGEYGHWKDDAECPGPDGATYMQWRG